MNAIKELFRRRAEAQFPECLRARVARVHERVRTIGDLSRRETFVYAHPDGTPLLPGETAGHVGDYHREIESSIYDVPEPLVLARLEPCEDRVQTLVLHGETCGRVQHSFSSTPCLRVDVHCAQLVEAMLSLSMHFDLDAILLATEAERQELSVWCDCRLEGREWPGESPRLSEFFARGIYEQRVKDRSRGRR